MGVIEVEYSEIRALTKAILAGTVDRETAAVALKGYSESGKRVDQLLKVYSMQIQHDKSARKVVSKNIISEGSAIDMGLSQAEEQIKCSAKGDLMIGRLACLDYSGLDHNIGTCQKCEHFSVTRKQVFAD